MIRFITLLVSLFAFTACGEGGPDEAPAEETQPEALEFAGDLDEQGVVRSVPDEVQVMVISIDYGDGQPPTERRLEVDGLLPDLVPALRDELGLSPSLDRDVDRRLFLTGVDGTTAGLHQRWNVMIERAHRYYRLDDLTEVVLEGGDRVFLVLDIDRDADGVGERLEVLYGTRDVLHDTDRDGLDDFAEIFGGWELADGRFVNSDPTNADTDGDGMGDAREQEHRSDPRASDR